METSCRGCGKPIEDGAPTRNVGKWVFCVPCFDRLMTAPRPGPGVAAAKADPGVAAAKADPGASAPELAPRSSPAGSARGGERESAPPAPSGPGPRQPERSGTLKSPSLGLSIPLVSAARRTCFVCEKEIRGDQFQLLGEWTLCLDCFAGVRRPAEEEAREAEERAKAKERAKGTHHGTPWTIEAPRASAPRTECARCARSVPHGGFYVWEGKSYCPDCFYMIRAEATARMMPAGVPAGPESAPGSAPSQAGSAPAAAPTSAAVKAPLAPRSPAPVPASASDPDACSCESCLRPVARANLKNLDGFAICQACLSADAESALVLARARHKDYLKRMRDALGSSE